MKPLYALPLAACLLLSALSVRADTLIKTDFETPASRWANAAASAPRNIRASVAYGAFGTVDTQGSADASEGLRLVVTAAGGAWRAGLSSGPLAQSNRETRLDKLTLAFSLFAPSTRPVTVRVESFDSKKRRTGGLVGRIYPAAPAFYQRYALDLDTLRPDGAGKFQPTAPFVQFSFELTGEGAGEAELRVDNVNYATPAYYVSPKGRDTHDGRTEATALATPQKALDLAQPGDIIVLMDGTYDAGRGTVASFRRGGLPDAWIVLKNYPGQHPLLTSTGWNIVAVVGGSREKPSDAPSLCYLEMRGLHVRGQGDVAKQKYPEAMNLPDSRTNSNGIGIDGRYTLNVPHHLRIADNLVEYCPGGGIGAGEADWVTVENNVSRCNAWTTIYAPSGISILGAYNFDATDNVYKKLVRNNTCYRNETYEIWKEVKRVSDGNGIIIDVNQKTQAYPNGSYRGRTLVQSNLCFDNGGSGIHTVKANRVDIIGNTTYLNSASKSLQYGQIFTYQSDDVRIMDNILVAPVADTASGAKPYPLNASRFSPNVVFSHNLYFGGNIPPTMGEGDFIADPLFVRPSRDSKIADFHLRPDSPALGKGVTMPFGPFLDLSGKPRKPAPALGAYEK